MAQREGARQTQARIIDAAFGLFAERGWEGTTMAAVAKAAQVAPQTMYFSFGSKPALLHKVTIAKRTGPDESTVVAERQWFAEAVAAHDQRRSLALSVEGGTEVLRRLSPIAHAMASAELVDDEFADVMQRIRAERSDGMGRLVGAFAAKGGLAVPSAIAADVLAVVQSMGTYHSFAAECGWSPDRYKAWAYRALTQLLPTLPPARARKLDLSATADLPYHEELERLLPA